MKTSREWYRLLTRVVCGQVSSACPLAQQEPRDWTGEITEPYPVPPIKTCVGDNLSSAVKDNKRGLLPRGLTAGYPSGLSLGVC